MNRNEPLKVVNAWANETVMPSHKVPNKEHIVDMKYIHKPYLKRPTTQAFSCFAETRAIDFTKNQTRDEVSFLKKLARVEKAKELNLDPDYYNKILREAKTKRLNIVINSQKPRGKTATKRAPGFVNKDSLESFMKEMKHSTIR